jgi:5-methylthioribose kinase
VVERYELLEPDTVAGYVAQHDDLARMVDVDSLTVREISEGNLNAVFLCRDRAGRGLVLKQALPYVRVAGPGLPLTPQRAAAEAHAYREHGRWAPEYVPRLLAFDAARYILAVEDLSDHRVWRDALTDGERHDGAAACMGRYVGRVAFRTSLLGKKTRELQQGIADTLLPEMREATDSIVLTDPFSGAERNWYQAELQPDAERLQASAVRAAAGRLKHVFSSHAEALIHGDLHTGSVLVRGDGSTRAFDAEFSFYGPVGFDLGLLCGNFLVTLARDHVLGRDEHAAWTATLPAEAWRSFETEWRTLWPERVDERLFTDAFLERRLGEVWRDATAFAGAEVARWVVGVAHVSDLETLEPDARAVAGRGLLATARRLLLEAREIDSPDDMVALAREEIVKAAA